MQRESNEQNNLRVEGNAPTATRDDAAPRGVIDKEVLGGMVQPPGDVQPHPEGAGSKK